MNMCKKITIAFLFSLLSLSFGNVYSQQTKKLTAEKHNDYGLVYTLPNTAFRIDVTLENVTKIAGPFYKYAKLFAGTSDVITKNSSSRSVKDVKVTPFGIPNQNSRYLMQLKAGATTFISVGEDNMLIAINKDNVGMSENAESESQPTKTESLKPDINNFLNYVNEDFITAISDYKKAQILGEELMEIREAKVSLTRGTAETMPTDGRQLELMLHSLSDQENSLMNAFRGITNTEIETFSFIFIPDPEKDLLYAYFPEVNIKVELSDISSPSLPVDSKGEEKKLPKDAVIYKIPGTAQMTVTNDDRILYTNIFEIAQLGIDFGLAPSLFTDKKEPSFAIFDPATGALKELGNVK